MYLKRLKDLREDNDLTQETISKLLNITRPHYSLYETGKRDIPIYLLRVLAKFYETTIDYIVGNTNQKTDINNHLNPNPYTSLASVIIIKQLKSIFLEIDFIFSKSFLLVTHIITILSFLV